MSYQHNHTPEVILRPWGDGWLLSGRSETEWLESPIAVAVKP